MKAVFSAVQFGHDPKRYLSVGRTVHYPEQPERVRRLMQGARKAGVEFHATRSFDKEHYTAVHSERFVDFLAHGYGEWHSLPNAFEEMMPSTRPVPGLNDYPAHIIGRAGWHLSDFSCPVVAKTWGAVKASADTALTAAAAVAAGDRAVYALCRPPGHHAQRERAAGFCYLNNAAIAARFLRNSTERVAVLDIDVHHGNGTQEIFYQSDDVLTVSVHANPDNFYPFFHGQQSQTGAGAGLGFNKNIIVPVKADTVAWLKAVEEALGAIMAFNPGALVVSLGLDAHEADPLAGGAVSTEGFGEMALLIQSAGLPTLIVQEGGYLTPYLGDNLASFLIGFETSGA